MSNHPSSGDDRFVDVDVSEQTWGSDYIADLFKAFDVPFVAFNPGSSFAPLEESIVNYNDNEPTVIQAPHEGIAVAMAHGYAKAAGEPGLCLLHDIVGTLHGAMSIFNAYIDRVPILLVAGTGPMRKGSRVPIIHWIHTALIQGNLVRDYVKWDDQPWTIDDVADSLLRGYRLADTPPKAPTYVAIDVEIQEMTLDEPRPMPHFERYRPPTRMAADPRAIEACVDHLLDADLPIFVVDQVGDSVEAVDLLVEVAELLGAPVFDIRWRRYNFPNTHPLDLSGSTTFTDADVMVQIDVWSAGWLLRSLERDLRDPVTVRDVVDGDLTLIDIGTDDLGISSLVPNTYELTDADLSILADPTLVLAQLRDAITDRLDGASGHTDAIEDRRAWVAARHDELRAGWRETAADRWDERPISTARLAGEIWDVIKDDDWALVNGQLRGWLRRLWEVDEFDQYIGGRSGGEGVGYGIGAAIGAALAYTDSDRIPINLQADGDLMFYQGALWTLGHYDIPLFSVMHNNRSLYNSTEHRIELADERGRDASVERAHIGTGYRDPTPDYAKIAEAQGVAGFGPVEEPDELASTLEQAWSTVKSGKPVLVDVICQPR